MKPTRLLGRIPKLANILYEGPPQFDSQEAYLGPLPWDPSGAKRKLIGKSADGFATTSAAAWPPDLCKALASVMLDAGPTAQAGNWDPWKQKNWLSRRLHTSSPLRPGGSWNGGRPSSSKRTGLEVLMAST